MEEYFDYIESNPVNGFEDWVDSLSNDITDGMSGACWSWIDAWGSGGGSYDTELRAKEVIEELGPSSPKKLADAVYHAIADVTESPLSASCIVKLMIEEVMAELLRNNNSTNCESCRWWDSFQGVCFNGDSPYCADFIDADKSCYAWEEKRSNNWEDGQEKI